MKRLLLTIFISLTISTTVTSANQVDTLVMSRLFNFMHQYEEDLDGFTTNVYAKHLFQVNKRNIGLLAIPSMYSISHGERTFVCEEYSRFTFKGIGEYENKRQVYCTTIPLHNIITCEITIQNIDCFLIKNCTTYRSGVV